jgi:thiol:disulfide interchange protein DsbC
MKILLFLALAGFSLSACAGDVAPGGSTAAATAAPAPASPATDKAPAAGTPAARAREALHSLDPSMPIERIEDAPIPGFQAAIVGGQVIYVSDDGKYLLQGTAYDIAARRDLGEEAMKSLRVELMRDMPPKDRIVFAPKDPKYTLTVFTDIECGYCRKLHSEIAQINRLGIAVQYVAFPRMGLGSEDYRKMVAVWCAADRRQALTDAKNDRPVAARECTNPVALQYRLGQRMGLTGTPMILAGDGTMLGGYLPPQQLRAALDELARGGAPAASTATGGP